MKIVYKNFEITVGEDSNDLYCSRPPRQVHKVKDKGENVKVCLGYFSSLDSCIRKIIQVELSTRDEIVDLTKFLELYRNIWEDIISTINDTHDGQMKLTFLTSNETLHTI